MASRKITLVNWNARSLLSKKIETAAFLEERKIDVAIFTETHLKPDTNISFPLHSLVRLDRNNTRGGGVAIAVRKGMKFFSLPSFNLKLIEAIGIEIHTTIGAIIVVAAYLPRQVKDQDGSAAQLRGDIAKLTRRRTNFIIAGDLNAKHQIWGNLRSNKNGMILSDDLQSGFYTILSPDVPTYYSPSGTPSTLDVYITNLSRNISSPIVIEELSSDHFPVILELGEDAVTKNTKRKNYEQVNWSAFQREVDSCLNIVCPLETTNDIDCALNTIETAITSARNNYVRELAPVSNAIKLDNTTKYYIRLRNIYRRQFQRTRLPEKKAQYKQLSKIIQERVEHLRNESFNRKLRQLPNHSKPFWKLSKVLKSKPRPVPPLNTDNSLGDVDRLITPTEKANALGQHFVSSHGLGQSIVSRHEPAVAEGIAMIDSNLVNVPNDQVITADELLAVIKKCKNMKAPGFDNIFNLELKHQSTHFFERLAFIFNRCLELGYFPSRWKLAKVIPILKSGKDPSSPRSYRPISLLSALSKLFEKVILTRLLEFADGNNVFLREQFGFRKGYSTTHQLSRVTNIIKRNKSVAKTSVMALLDIEKAFDNVWHDGLIYKLQQCNFPAYIVRIIHNYLRDRSFQVSLSGASSDTFPIIAGVPQGSLLGPVLFNVFTSDIPRLPNGGVLSQYADDTALLYKGRVIRTLTRKLQEGLDALSEYFASWKICINAAKTQTIVFPHTRSPRLVPPASVKIRLAGQDIAWSKEVMYLGLTLDSKLNFKSHIEKTATKCNILIKSLYPLINRRSKLSPKNKLAVFKQLFIPVIEYSAPVWECCAKTHKLKLQRTQNKILKMILNMPWHTRTSIIHELAGIEPLQDRIAATCEKFRNRCVHSTNETIQNIFN